MICCDNSNGLTHVANKFRSKNRLISRNKSIRCLARHILRSEYCRDAADEQCVGGINGNDTGVWMRRTKSCAPQHIFCPHVGRKRERTCNFCYTVRSKCACAKCVTSTNILLDCTHEFAFRTWTTASTAAKMRPYPVQRQMLPEMDSLTSSSVGFGFLSSR